MRPRLRFCYFNPRSLAGATLIGATSRIKRPFQSTLPRGSDRSCEKSSMASLLDFNPRSLAGATNAVDSRFVYPIISIHAPSRERRCHVGPRKMQYQFQSTLPRGSDLQTLISISDIKNFNPRSLAGATALIITLRQGDGISIHAPSRERRLTSGVSTAENTFQSTLPRGSDPRC